MIFNLYKSETDKEINLPTTPLEALELLESSRKLGKIDIVILVAKLSYVHYYKTDRLEKARRLLLEFNVDQNEKIDELNKKSVDEGIDVAKEVEDIKSKKAHKHKIVHKTLKNEHNTCQSIMFAINLLNTLLM